MTSVWRASEIETDAAISMTPRRIVTGLDAHGKSAVLIDGPSDVVAWATAEVPVDNSGTADTGGPFSFAMPAGGSKFLMIAFPPTPPGELSGAGIHSTNTIDYLTVVSGEIVLITETGEVTCRAGDMIVDRGVLHGWRNDGAETALVSCVMIDAAPVGKGATHT